MEESNAYLVETIPLPMTWSTIAEIPTAVIEASAATENPCCINRKGSVTVAKPTLKPYGKTRKTIEDGSVVVFIIHRFDAYDFPTIIGFSYTSLKQFLLVKYCSGKYWNT